MQGFAKGLGVVEKILSPTFILMKKFEIHPVIQLDDRIKLKRKTFVHIDCYRTKNAGEILTIGFKKIISDPQNIIAIEWADRIEQKMPRDTIWIHFKFINPQKRKIQITIRETMQLW